jgi:protein-S-isoprenylcysteine O-methyltransferase Ste14
MKGTLANEIVVAVLLLAASHDAHDAHASPRRDADHRDDRRDLLRLRRATRPAVRLGVGRDHDDGRRRVGDRGAGGPAARAAAPGGEGRVHDHHRLLSVPLLVLSWILAGLDLGRFHWSDTMPTWLRVLGLVGYGAAILLDLWAMRTNRFFSSVIRLQRDRGHEVITGGPYRIVRHPGYTGMIAAIVFEGFVLGSWVAMLPVLVVVLLFLRRTINEDRMLRRDLTGYEAYASRVRCRLVPGVW